MPIFEQLKELIMNDPSDSTPQDPAPSTEPVQRQLSDDGRVLRLLVQNDGQIRKSVLLDETGWEPAKADTVLAEMEAADDVRLVPHGDTTLVCRPGYEPKGHQQI
jgi:hypothetical protein